MAPVEAPTAPRLPSRLYRWVVLVFVSLAMFGNYYFYDALSPLADVLQKQLHFSDQNIGLLNSFYSIAPIATVLLGGFIIDRIGTRKAVRQSAFWLRRLPRGVSLEWPHAGNARAGI